MRLTNRYILQLVHTEKMLSSELRHACECPYCGKRHSNASRLRKHLRQRKYRARNLTVEMERGGPDGVVYAFPSSLGLGQNRTDKLQVSKLCGLRKTGGADYPRLCQHRLRKQAVNLAVHRLFGR